MERRSDFRNVAIATVLVTLALGLAVWAQGTGIVLRVGGLVSAGGPMSAGTTEVTGSLGSWFSTEPMENAAGVRVEPGLLTSGVPAGVTGDIDGDSDVDFDDFLLFAGAFGASTGDPLYITKADLDSNGIVDFDDFLIFAEVFGT